MEVFFESRNTEGAKLREMALMRARFVLRRLAWLVPTVRVRLSETTDPGRGTDKHCRVEVETHGRGAVIVHTRSGNWRAALDTALERAARLLLRASRRIDAMGRTRRPALDFRR